MSQRVSPDRYSRRARITRLNALRQNTTQRMTYDTARPARTVRIFVGDEPLIVDDPSSAAGPDRVLQFAYESNAWKSRPCVTLPYDRHYKYMILLYFISETLLISWLSDGIFTLPEQILFLTDERYFIARYFLDIHIYIFERGCLYFNQVI